MASLLLFKRAIWGGTLIGLSSCATNPVQDIPVNDANVAPLSQSQQISAVSNGAATSTDVAQIGSISGDYSASQISSDIDTPQLTVEQLKAYADRCAPGQYSANSSDITALNSLCGYGVSLKRKTKLPMH